MSEVSYVGICFEHMPDSSTLASLKEYYICFTSDFEEACGRVYSYMLNHNESARINATYHIEKYDISLEELHSRKLLPYPINFFTFNAEYTCICNGTKEVVWQPY